VRFRVQRHSKLIGREEAIAWEGEHLVQNHEKRPALATEGALSTRTATHLLAEDLASSTANDQ
jgi:hypothetical protein